MMKRRTSTLDGGLYEILQAASSNDLLISDRPTPGDAISVLALEAEPLRRATASRPASVAPAGKTSVKLITASGTNAAVADALAEMGCDVVSTGPQLLVANVPVEKLDALDELQAKGLLRAEQPRRLHFRMDQARGNTTRTDIALAQHPNLMGEGVVVGVLDSGVDWRHPDFRNDDDTTRLEMFIHAVHDSNTGSDMFDEYSASQINSALNGFGVVPNGDLNGHGTHCASIAAGNGRASASEQFRGIAPRATLMAGRSDTLHDTHTIEGIRRVFEQAGSRPAVINLSLGSHIGPHDGTSGLENVIARETGPGRIIVVAAGNEGSDRIHFRGSLVKGKDLDIEFTIRDALQFIDVWIPRGDEADITVIDPDGLETTPDGSIQQTSAGAFKADLREDKVNRDVNLTFAVAGNEIGRRWTIRLHAGNVRQGTVHAWAQTRNAGTSRNIFMSNTSPLFSIGMPATEERAISVGAFVSRSQIRPGDSDTALDVGQLSPFSSHGPTRHGAQRPDITAPGQHVVAALAAGSFMATSPDYAARRLPGNNYISIQGTSMATPFVVGVIALMLEQEPELTPEDIQIRLRATAQRDEYTGAVWNPGFGYGKIDTESLLNYKLTS